MSDPLRIGVLGASRIAREAIVEPAHANGHRLVAVAARDRGRAEEFAATHGVERVQATYEDLVADPEVELVYNGLVNSAHTPWNLAALAAGKHVLSEKPLSLTAAEAVAVREAAEAAEAATGRGLPLRPPSRGCPAPRAGADRRTRGPRAGGPRAGHPGAARPGSAMVPRTRRRGADGPRLLRAACRPPAGPLGSGRAEAGPGRGKPAGGRPGVDERMSAELAYPSGLLAAVRWDMAAADRRMVWTVTGRDAVATLPAFAVPHADPRVLIERDDQTTEEPLGDRTSYAYQLAASAAPLRDGATWAYDLDDSVRTTSLIDDCYRSAGLSSARGVRQR